MRPVQTKAFPPPTSGWVSSGNAIAPPEDGAEVLDNWFPTARGARMRRGSALHATLDDTPVRLFTYRSGSQEVLFGASETAVYDITSPADPAVTPTAELSSQTSGDWSAAQISTAGGDFLCVVNGSDDAWNFDGTTVETYDALNTFDITGVDHADLSHVNAYGSRLFFVEEGTMDVWYLAVDSIGGAATKFPMGSVFTKGGFVLFTATWSSDAGESMADRFVAVTSEGEAAVYEGFDPASWSKVGVYDVGVPIDKHSAIKMGGELVFLTKTGLVPISAAISSDKAQLANSALSFPIEDAWRDTITNRPNAHPIPIIHWQAGNMLIVGTGGMTYDGPVSFVANSRTAAWCRFVGWDVQCAAIMDDELYFGSEGGAVFNGDVGGNDNTESYRAIYVPTWSTCGSPGLKHVQQANAVFRGTVRVTYAAKAFADFDVGEPPNAPLLAAPEGLMTWGSFTWGSFVWGGVGSYRVTNTWKTAYAKGFVVAPCFVTSTINTEAPDVEILATQIRYEVGSPL